MVLPVRNAADTAEWQCKGAVRGGDHPNTALPRGGWHTEAL